MYDRYIGLDGSLQTRYVATCDHVCVDGTCVALPGSSCTGSGVSMSADGRCLLKCIDGKYKKSPFCDHVKVDSYNNQAKLKLFEKLKVLPESFFENLRFDVDIIWQDVTRFPVAPTGEYNDAQGYAYGYAYPFSFTSPLMVIPADVMVNDDNEGIYHEILHRWAFNQVRQYPVWLPFADVVNSVLYISQSEGLAPVPNDYKELVGCSKTANGNFTYKLLPITDYAKDNSNPKDLSCGEDFADSGAWYVTNPCELKTKSPERYDYFKTHVFTDLDSGIATEYIPITSCL